MSKQGGPLKQSAVAGFVERAPRSLCEWFEAKNRSGRKTLRRLLSDNDMRRPWSEISRAVNSAKGRPSTGPNDPYLQLWSQIRLLLKRCRNVTKADRQKKADFEKIAARAASLADLVEDSELDVGLATLLGEDPTDSIAFGPSSLWIVDILRQLRYQAEKAADKPLTVKHDTRSAEARYFVVGLSEYFQRTYGSQLHGSIARIAAIAFQDDSIDSDFVKKATRRAKKRGTKPTRKSG